MNSRNCSSPTSAASPSPREPPLQSDPSLLNHTQINSKSPGGLSQSQNPEAEQAQRAQPDSTTQSWLSCRSHAGALSLQLGTPGRKAEPAGISQCLLISSSSGPGQDPPGAACRVPTPLCPLYRGLCASGPGEFQGETEASTGNELSCDMAVAAGTQSSVRVTPPGSFSTTKALGEQESLGYFIFNPSEPQPAVSHCWAPHPAPTFIFHMEEPSKLNLSNPAAAGVLHGSPWNLQQKAFLSYLSPDFPALHTQLHRAQVQPSTSKSS